MLVLFVAGIKEKSTSLLNALRKKKRFYFNVITVKIQFVPFQTQWNAVTPFSEAPQKSGRISRVAVLKGFSK